MCAYTYTYTYTRIYTYTCTYDYTYIYPPYLYLYQYLNLHEVENIELLVKFFEVVCLIFLYTESEPYSEYGAVSGDANWILFRRVPVAVPAPQPWLKESCGVIIIFVKIIKSEHSDSVDKYHQMA